MSKAAVLSSGIHRTTPGKQPGCILQTVHALSASQGLQQEGEHDPAVFPQPSNPESLKEQAYLLFCG